MTRQIRVAAEYTAPEPTPIDGELAAIDRQQRRFFWLSIATMVVSFVHMVGALALFSDGSFIGMAAAVLMTALVDGATWVVTGYYDYAKRRNLTRGWLVLALLVVALLISCGLNLAYLIQHMPASLPPLIGYVIAVAFALFIPLCIAVAASERGQLEDDRTQHAAQPAAPVNVDKKTSIQTVAPIRRKALPPDPAATIEMVPAPATTAAQPADERGATWLTLVDSGATMQRIADDHGVSRQYVSKVVNQHRQSVVDTQGATQ